MFQASGKDVLWTPSYGSLSGNVQLKAGPRDDPGKVERPVCEHIGILQQYVMARSSFQTFNSQISDEPLNGSLRTFYELVIGCIQIIKTY